MIDTGAFFDELQKIGEERAEDPQAPTFWQGVRYGVLEPLGRVGLPVGLGVGLGYLGGGAGHYALSKAPHISELWHGLTPAQQVTAARALKVLGTAGGALGGVALGYHRHQAYQQMHEDRKRREAAAAEETA